MSESTGEITPDTIHKAGKRIDILPTTEFEVVELAPGKFNVARKLHKSHDRRTGNTTVVWEGVKRNGEKFKGTKAQILASCEPYSRKGDANKLATKANAPAQPAN